MKRAWLNGVKNGGEKRRSRVAICTQPHHFVSSLSL